MKRTVDVRGARVPALGFGTYRLTGDEARRATESALALGYRHVDTAQAYGNEAKVGAAVRESGVPRDDLWITSKVWFENADADAVHRSTHDSLGRLALDHLDLLLLHWPNDDVPMDETLGAMTRLLDEGAVRRIGVSNFTASQLDRALRIAPVSAVQVEYHPYLAQAPLLARCRRHDLLFTSYAPLARGRVVDDPVVQRVARAHGATPAQVTLAWHLGQPNVCAIPKASSEAHRRENLGALDLELNPDEMAALHGLAEGRRLIDPSFAPVWENAGTS